MVSGSGAQYTMFGRRGLVSPRPLIALPEIAGFRASCAGSGLNGRLGGGIAAVFLFMVRGKTNPADMAATTRTLPRSFSALPRLAAGPPSCFDSLDGGAPFDRRACKAAAGDGAGGGIGMTARRDDAEPDL